MGEFFEINGSIIGIMGNGTNGSEGDSGGLTPEEKFDAEMGFGNSELGRLAIEKKRIAYLQLRLRDPDKLTDGESKAIELAEDTTLSPDRFVRLISTYPIPEELEGACAQQFTDTRNKLIEELENNSNETPPHLQEQVTGDTLINRINKLHEQQRIRWGAKELSVIGSNPQQPREKIATRR